MSKDIGQNSNKPEHTDSNMDAFLERRARWTEALRSGEFKQCKTRLNRNQSYCCLGVACELFKDEIGIYCDDDGYDSEKYYMPTSVMKYLNMTTQNGEFLSDDEDRSLSRLNDAGATFCQIADVIDSNPLGLFRV